jgi:D-serine deaminase-like pyridoxal phosphate-dependent protein
VDYSIANLENVLTPALAIYSDVVDANIDFTLELLGGDANRWRPHVKTAKLESIMRRLVERGVMQFKCATTLELLTACRAGARDVLVAYPVAGANAARVRQIAEEHPQVRVSALVEDAAQIGQWRGSRLGLFVDINPGMDRTGMPQERVGEIAALAAAIAQAGLEFRGLHYYDGHLHQDDMAERTAAAHRGYDQLRRIADAVGSAGRHVGEVITAGTPAFPCSLSYAGFRGAPFVHRASPGTVVYGDATASEQLPADYRYRPAVVVVSRVVSRPRPDVITCDAGHKTLSVDCGVPNAVVIGHPELRPLRPSEEHLPIQVPAGAEPPVVGDLLYLVPRHVCPTVNNFDHALMVRAGRIVGAEPVTARGREAPLLMAKAGARQFTRVL